MKLCVIIQVNGEVMSREFHDEVSPTRLMREIVCVTEEYSREYDVTKCRSVNGKLIFTCNDGTRISIEKVYTELKN